MTNNELKAIKQRIGVTRHESDNCAFVAVDGKNIIVRAADTKNLIEAELAYSQAKDG